MAQLKNVIEILNLLPKTNCGQCNEKTCMAFAASVFKGEKPLALCPMIGPEAAGRYEPQTKKYNNPEQDMEAVVRMLKEQLRATDLAAAAARIGGQYDGHKLTLKVMGKEFSVDGAGTLITDLHANPWVTIPILSYILHCKGAPVSGRWVPMRELPNGKDWQHFFNHQCEKPLKKLADTYTDLFKDLVEIFNGQRIQNHYQSDVAVALYPLPLVPLLICYWEPDEGMESSLNIFFDATAEQNLGIQGLYALGTGITRMFHKLALRHGIQST
ncbi:MAG: DUF3786 domain-containing protein [Desulfobacteraceae bacterium]|nr:DUF3786 domain-containing protein [Desulfobacteraceae bacterium]